MYDQLNDILGDFIEPGEQIEDYAFTDSLTRLISSVKIPYNETQYKGRMSIKTAAAHSLNFLESLDPAYADRLAAIIRDGHIDLDFSEEGAKKLSSTYPDEDREKRIKLYVRGTVEDSYTLTHEFFHYDNMDLENLTNNWNLMTEGISIAGEGLQREYFRNLGIRDFRLNELDTLYALKVKANQLDFELQLIYAYMRYGMINPYVMSEILDGKDDFYFQCAYQDYQEIKRNNALSFVLLQRNIIGGVLANHMLYRIGENPKRVSEFTTVHDNCGEMDFLDTLSFLDLELADSESMALSNDSLNTLHKEYVYRVKNVFK